MKGLVKSRLGPEPDLERDLRDWYALSEELACSRDSYMRSVSMRRDPDEALERAEKVVLVQPDKRGKGVKR
jgi:hypothetical protein